MKRHTGRGAREEGQEGRGWCSVLPISPLPLLLLLHSLLRLLLLGRLLFPVFLLFLLLLISQPLFLLIFIF